MCVTFIRDMVRNNRLGGVPYVFGYRQSNGSYIHADCARSTILYFPSAKEFNAPYENFNITEYCVYCKPCNEKD